MPIGCYCRMTEVAFELNRGRFSMTLSASQAACAFKYNRDVRNSSVDQHGRPAAIGAGQQLVSI